MPATQAPGRPGGLGHQGATPAGCTVRSGVPLECLRLVRCPVALASAAAGSLRSRPYARGRWSAGLAGVTLVSRLGPGSAARRRGMTSQPASMGARAVGERPFPGRPEGTDTLPQIDHILVLMMENHTYDNWLGMLGRGPGQQPRGDGFTMAPDGQPTAANPTPDGKTQHAFHMP